MAGRVQREAVDLDRLQQRAELLVGQVVPIGGGEWGHAKVTLSPETMLALVAELRAGREVIEAVRLYIRHPLPTKPDPLGRPLGTAMAAYDQATGRPDPVADPSTHDRSGEGG